MLLRLLALLGPLGVYASLGLILRGLWQERRKLDWGAMIPAGAGLLASLLFVPSAHGLFFDEDIYIGISQNLSRAPVYQTTVYGSPGEIVASSYYKEPPGWPVLASLAMIVAGRREIVVFWLSRFLFASAIASVYHLASRGGQSRWQAFCAAVFFGAAPFALSSSASAATDVPAALLSTIGLWGLVTGNGALAAGGLGIASLTRMELVVLTPLLWLSSSIEKHWKLASSAITTIAFGHIAWVLSVTAQLAEAERTEAPFSVTHVWANLFDNIRFLLNPFSFVAIATVLAVVAAVKARDRTLQLPLVAPIVALFAVYCVFYAGSFDLNPRYSLQLLAPLSVLGASVLRPRYAIALVALVLPYLSRVPVGDAGGTFAQDHAAVTEFAALRKPDDLFLSAEHDVFLNQGARVMNTRYASEHPDLLRSELGRRRVLYYPGIRVGSDESEETRADRWIREAFVLVPISSKRITGRTVTLFTVQTR
jgi:hypothetical protein